MITTYVILKKLEPEEGEIWNQITAMTGTSARQAIRKVVSDTLEDGVYIAVPARSWKQETVKLTQKTALEFG